MGAFCRPELGGLFSVALAFATRELVRQGEVELPVLFKALVQVPFFLDRPG